MNIKIQKSKIKSNTSIAIAGSKSESNRLLLLQALYPDLDIENLSNSDDSKIMRNALHATSDVIDVHHAGTVMRFLTAYFSAQKGREVILTGSSRMQERPITILVDALNQLGAEITYLKNEGFPPIQIKGKTLTKNKVSLKANVSSQYISALLLIAPKLKQGIELSLEGVVTSFPYIKMTLNLLNRIGIETSWQDNVISVKPYSKAIRSKNIVVESDWSSASYFYSCIALSKEGLEIILSSYKYDSIQGDSALKEIYQNFGVETTFKNDTIHLVKKTHDHKALHYDLSDTPDIAQSIVVTCFGLGVACQISGLQTLKIKETDRLLALKTEIEKLGGQVEITKDSLQLSASIIINENIKISTYNDHRMAMSFAPLGLIVPIIIDDASVVSKSYPSFWEDLKHIGFKISQ